MDEIINNNDATNVIAPQDKSLQYLRELAERTVVDASELADAITQEAETEAAMIMEKAEAAQKAALETEQKARELMSEAQGRSDNIVAEANALAGRIKQEAQSEAAKARNDAEATQKEAAKLRDGAEAAQKEAAKVLEEVEEKARTAQRGANALIEALRKQILSDVEVMLASLDNFSVEIAQGGTATEDRSETILEAPGEPGASASSVSISDVHGNGRGEVPEGEDTPKSELATVAVASGQQRETTGFC